MKKQLVIFLISITLGYFAYQALFPQTAVPSESIPEITTVPEVDVERYMGTWYEIASIPMVFQKDCVKNTQAQYTLNDDGSIKVRNRCETEEGKTKAAKGRAWPTNAENTKLKVSFVNIFGWWIKQLSGAYWVVGLDKDYRWAIVGHPELKYGWILARKPILQTHTLKTITKQLEEQGYNSCDFILTPQDKGLTDNIANRPLCQHLGQSPWGLKPAQPKTDEDTSEGDNMPEDHYIG